MPPRLPTCSRFTAADASAAASTSYDPEKASYWEAVFSARGIPGLAAGGIVLGFGLGAVCVAAAASAAKLRESASSSASGARARRSRAAREELKKQQQRGDNSFDFVASSNEAETPISTSSSSTSSSAALPCLAALVLLLCAAALSFSCWGTAAAALALRGQPRDSWRAASGLATQAIAALEPGDAAVTLARQAQSGLLSLAQYLPAITSAATGSSSLSAASSSQLLSSIGLDVEALQADATSAAAAAGAVADAGGDAAAAVRRALTDGFEKAKRDYESRSEHVAAAATAGLLALTLGFVGIASVVLGLVSLPSAAAAACCFRRKKTNTSPASSPRTRRFLLAAALAFLAASLSAAAGLGGGGVASEASKDACLYGESAAARLVVSASSSSSSSTSSSSSNGDGDLSSRLALFYLDGGENTKEANSSVFSLLGISPDLEHLLLDDDIAAPKQAQNGTLRKTAALGGAALALLQSDAGRALVAKAGLPSRERRSILNLPETVASLRARAREFEEAAAPEKFTPSLLELKKLPCCALRAASAPWAAAATAGGFVLAAAAALACFAGVAAAGAEGEAPPPPVTEEEEQGAQQRQRASCGCWPRRSRRRDGFFRSRASAGGAGAVAGGAGGDVFPEGEVEPRPWPTL